MDVVECTIPPDMTIERWRQLRRGGVPKRGNPWSLLLAAARRAARREHLHVGAAAASYHRGHGAALHATPLGA